MQHHMLPYHNSISDMNPKILLLLALAALTLAVTSDQEDNDDDLGLGLGGFGDLLTKGLFGGDGNAAGNKFSLTRGHHGEKDEENEEDPIVGSLRKEIQEAGAGMMMKELGLPYEAMLPKRKAAPKRPKVEQRLGALSETMKALNSVLKDRAGLTGSKGADADKLDWQNPEFQDNGNFMTMNQIFGDRHRGHRVAELDEDKVTALLGQQMPALKGGKIISMDGTRFKKGVYLNIEYSSAQNDIYTIKAKYKPKNNKLTILSMSESENPFAPQADEDSEQDAVKELEEVKETQIDYSKFSPEEIGQLFPEVDYDAFMKTIQMGGQEVEVGEKENMPVVEKIENTQAAEELNEQINADDDLENELGAQGQENENSPEEEGKQTENAEVGANTNQQNQAGDGQVKPYVENMAGDSDAADVKLPEIKNSKVEQNAQQKHQAEASEVTPKQTDEAPADKPVEQPAYGGEAAPSPKNEVLKAQQAQGQLTAEKDLQLTKEEPKQDIVQN